MTLCCSVFIASSLDGFIARQDGAIDWLERANGTVTPGEDCGYAAFMRFVDLLVMGRHTFDKVMEFPQWPYADKPVWVVTRSPLAAGQALPDKVRLTAASPAALVEAAQQAGYGRLYLDRGRLIQSFLQAGLVTDITLTTIPLLLGQDRPLFGSLPEDQPLALVSSHAASFGFVQSHYRVLPR
ncbi:deaminase [Bordetella sp. J329]|nr:deaminase [Bordetella sp. J329]